MMSASTLFSFSSLKCCANTITNCKLEALQMNEMEFVVSYSPQIIHKNKGTLRELFKPLRLLSLYQHYQQLT